MKMRRTLSFYYHIVLAYVCDETSIPILLQMLKLVHFPA
jgi:hypothetical protein